MIYAKGEPNWTTLYYHLMKVRDVIYVLCEEEGYEDEFKNKAVMAAIIHDLGKAHPDFQNQLTNGQIPEMLRHEITSLFFLPLIKEEWWEDIIEMVVAHHKSVKSDPTEKGFLDLVNYNDRDEIIEAHMDGFNINSKWEEWHKNAIKILSDIIGIPLTTSISRDAIYERVFDYIESVCRKKVKELGPSLDKKGLLMAADHFASAMNEETHRELKNIFKIPDLTSIWEKNNNADPVRYPFSNKKIKSSKPHTLIKGPTGSGKTIPLLLRCIGRLFYILPFQASINAMYKRLLNEFESDKVADIRLLHSSSDIVIKDEEGHKNKIHLQDKVGASIKVMTPHQLAKSLTAVNGYETILYDVRGCDVILDEIHTYSGHTQEMVLRLIKLLDTLGCRIHIGTATMPTSLEEQIINILGKDNVFEVDLNDKEFEAFNRHFIHKIDYRTHLRDFERSNENVISKTLDQHINQNDNILVVFNQVRSAQEFFRKIQKYYPDVDKMLIHSRYKRKDRTNKEDKLINHYNEKTSGPCIVVATQVVEVSLDIDFDMMITEIAPLDSLIQRFGRVNRNRPDRLLKHIYVVAPPNDEFEHEGYPYNIDILRSSFNEIEEGVLEEKNLQEKLDAIYPELIRTDIDHYVNFSDNGEWKKIGKLCHKSVSGDFIEMLQISQENCIMESDIENYKNSGRERQKFEIPVNINKLKGMERLGGVGAEPFVINDDAYDMEIGLDENKIGYR